MPSSSAAAASTSFIVEDMFGANLREETVEDSGTPSGNSHPFLLEMLLHPRPINPAKVQVVDKVKLSDTDWQFHHHSTEEAESLTSNILRSLRNTCNTIENTKRKAIQITPSFLDEEYDRKCFRKSARGDTKTLSSSVTSVKDTDEDSLFSSSSPPPLPPSSNTLLDGSTGTNRFRKYQSDQWSARFQDFVNFVQKHGRNGVIPHKLSSQPNIAQWVKRQRYQYKLLKRGLPSTLSPERLQLLNDIGFIWDIHKTVWDEHMAELRTYYTKYGNCNVPRTSSRHTTTNDLASATTATTATCDYAQLAGWIKVQRHQYRLFQQGQPSTMTHERAKQFEQLGIHDEKVERR